MIAKVLLRGLLTCATLAATSAAAQAYPNKPIRFISPSPAGGSAVAETVPDYDTVSWQAVLGPKALPRDIAARWNSELDRILYMPDLKARLATEGMELIGGPASRFLEVLQRDVAHWQNVAKVAGIKPGA